MDAIDTLPTPVTAQPRTRTPSALLREVLDIRARVSREARATLTSWSERITRSEFRPCAENLAAYLALRRHDLARVQQELEYWGISPLSRSEAHVMHSLDAVAATLAAVAREELPPDVTRPGDGDYARGYAMLEEEKRALFGADPGGPQARIMVTLPAEAASDMRLCKALIAGGVDCARINCAHDSADLWRGMAANMRAAARDAERTCPILIDLGGSKMRIKRVSGEPPVRVRSGDRLALVVDGAVERELPTLFCSDREIIEHLRKGATVWIDDGKIGCTVEETQPDGVLLRVAAAREKGNLLKPGKGLNCLDTTPGLPALTAKDLVDLDFVVQHADMVGYSFVQTPEDVRLLQRELAARGRADMPVVLKIETRAAVQNLPSLIVATAGRQPAAVMLARGDLALALGFERLAEVQEEILSLCEAAHVPAIWATQVLERLIKKGRPARAEATDAAMSQRAECVMLNKGPYLVKGVRFLEDVLRRMDRHQSKKSPRLTALHAWRADQTLKV
ncbi:MAG TPA: pyruvate kinase [Burkholderiales bacterium]|nr:pyruvate kinase [Burkholderiales bacterium]